MPKLNWDEWISSDAGERCLETQSLCGYNGTSYLRNRLHMAFHAGACSTEQATAHDFEPGLDCLCSNCRWATKCGEDIICRINPPIASGGEMAIWPVVDSCDWCSHWTQAVVPAPERPMHIPSGAERLETEIERLEDLCRFALDMMGILGPITLGSGPEADRLRDLLKSLNQAANASRKRSQDVAAHATSGAAPESPSADT